MQLNSDYKPVSCDLSDEMEAISIKQTPVYLRFQGESGIDFKLAKIVDVFTESHADFIKLSDGTTIRLDKIIDWRADT